ncbi:hypothetical protein BC940DRAFT_306846 [Gongronella butleri]|nr:hypothetical protein BC940DRAFT_306846 [Gongronella butleri]
MTVSSTDTPALSPSLALSTERLTTSKDMTVSSADMVSPPLDTLATTTKMGTFTALVATSSPTLNRRLGPLPTRGRKPLSSDAKLQIFKKYVMAPKEKRPSARALAVQLGIKSKTTVIKYARAFHRQAPIDLIRIEDPELYFQLTSQ